MSSCHANSPRGIYHDGKWCGTTKGKWYLTTSHSSPLHPVCFPITQLYTGATAFPWKVLTMELDNFCPGTCRWEFRGEHWNQQQPNLPHSQGTVVWFLRWRVWNGAGTYGPCPTPMSSACLLSVENFSQRISLIREVRTRGNKGKQSKEMK